MVGDIIPVCQPAGQRRALPVFRAVLAGAAERESVSERQKIDVPHSLILPLYSHIQIFLSERFDLFCRLYIFIKALCQLLQDNWRFGSPPRIFDAI